MHVSVISLVILAIIVYARCKSFFGEVQEYGTSCKAKTYGKITYAYYSINPMQYENLRTFDIQEFNVVGQDRLNHNMVSASELLIKTACVCADLEMNSFTLIVVPMITDEWTTDALTLCVYHDGIMSMMEVLDFPDYHMNHWLIAMYITKMPRSLIAPADEVNDCVDINGHPTPIIPGSQACYYLNYAKFQEVDGVIEVDNKAYYGPFLGSQLPNFTELRTFSKSGQSTLDFATMFDYVTCSMLKTQSRLSSTDIQTGCSHRLFYDPESASQLVIVSCCCRGQNDPNCKEVTEAAKTKKILCLKGDLGAETGFYFATECAYTTVKKFKRIVQHGDIAASFEHQKALGLRQPAVKFEPNGECGLASVTTTCEQKFVDITEKGCCRRSNFCNLHRALRNIIQRCRFYYGENQKKEGCHVVFYRANNQWYQSSAVWYEFRQSQLIHLYSARLPGSDATYKVSLGFLFEKRVDLSCMESSNYVQNYYVITCPSKKCDIKFNKEFFTSLDENVITKALGSTSIPLCESGSATTQTTNLTFHEQLHPRNTPAHVYGVYCVVRLKIDFDNTNVYTINVSYGPEYPLPQACTKNEIDFNDLKYTCCYNGSSNVSYINPECHHSTILSVAHKLINPDKDKDADPSDLAETIEPLTRQTVHEIPDDCTQKNIGFIGTPSQLCKPGGSGCFHLKGVDHAKENVMASCVGRAEQMAATREDAFERYHGALVCLTEEARDTCHLVDDGIQKYYLCCCTATEIRNNVAHCVKNSNMMFNSITFEAKRISDFKDKKEDDDEE